MLVSLQAYQTYILPLASFVAQLVDLPPTWARHERALTTLLCPGARGWATPQFLGQLKSLGYAAELPDARALSAGARCRVYRWENQANGGLRLRPRARRIAAAWSSSPHLSRTTCWASWLQSNMAYTVVKAYDDLSNLATQENSTVDTLVQGTREDPLPRRQWQRRCGHLLHPQNVGIRDVHLRRRLDQWPLQVLPARRVPRATAILQHLGPLVQPCVWAAACKALVGGWTTNPGAPCPFGCPHGQDTILHYAFCRVLQELFQAKLQLELGVATSRLDDFLLFTTTSDDALARRAQGLYATFKATNAARHGPTEMRGAWLQAYAEGSAPRRH